MIAFVLDSSVTIAWCFLEEITAEAISVMEALNTAKALVPSVWPLEVANVLTIAERRGRIRAGEVRQVVILLNTLPIQVDDDTSRYALSDILTLARTHRLSAYDAAYLDLAMRRSLPLATLDQSLRRCAESLGVKVLPGPTGAS